MSSIVPLGTGWVAKIEKTEHELRAQLAADSANLPTLPKMEPATLAGLCTYLDLLASWGPRVDLTAARTSDELVELALADAFVLAAFAEPAQSWVDVGSGAGAPGIPLTVLVPSLRMDLVEPRQKRVAFLRAVSGSLAGLSLQVKRGRSETLPSQSWDVALSRATFPPQQWLEVGATLARSAVWVLLARAAPPAIPHWHAAIDVEYEWPLGRAPRRAVKYVPIHADGNAVRSHGGVAT